MNPPIKVGSICLWRHMTKIQSRIGSSNTRSAPTRKWTVGDGPVNPAQDQDFSDYPEVPQQAYGSKPPQGRQQIDPSQVQAMREQAQQRDEASVHQSTQDARRRVDIITGLGRKTKNVEIDGNTFTLRTLKSFEQNLVAQASENAEKIDLPNGNTIFTPVSFWGVRMEVLSHSLWMIDNQPIDIILGASALPWDEKIEARKELLEEMDSALTEFLYLEFQALSREAYDGYAPKTAEEAKEVVDTIRKSGQDS